jgi:DNA-binding NarL/FixJ family response regulator
MAVPDAPLHRIACGKTLFRPGLAEYVLRSVQKKSAAPAPVRRQDTCAPTPRQADVLRLLTGGFSNRGIAGLLQDDEGTIGHHVSRIFSKPGARDRLGAVLRGAGVDCLKNGRPAPSAVAHRYSFADR